MALQRTAGNSPKEKRGERGREMREGCNGRVDDSLPCYTNHMTH